MNIKDLEDKYKFDGYQAHLIKKGLELVEKEGHAELDALEKEGKRPFLTKGFLTMTIKEANEKLVDLTIKDKHMKT